MQKFGKVDIDGLWTLREGCGLPNTTDVADRTGEQRQLPFTDLNSEQDDAEDNANGDDRNGDGVNQSNEVEVEDEDHTYEESGLVFVGMNCRCRPRADEVSSRFGSFVQTSDFRLVMQQWYAVHEKCSSTFLLTNSTGTIVNLEPNISWRTQSKFPVWTTSSRLVTVAGIVKSQELSSPQSRRAAYIWTGCLPFHPSSRR